jgi:hypothetical protein
MIRPAHDAVCERKLKHMTGSPENTYQREWCLHIQIRGGRDTVASQTNDARLTKEADYVFRQHIINTSIQFGDARGPTGPITLRSHKQEESINIFGLNRGYPTHSLPVQHSVVDRNRSFVGSLL